MQPGDYIQTRVLLRRFGLPPIPKGSRGTVINRTHQGVFVDFHHLKANAWLLEKEAAVIVKGEDA
jgi:hypothetical protein